MRGVFSKAFTCITIIIINDVWKKRFLNDIFQNMLPRQSWYSFWLTYVTFCTFVTKIVSLNPTQVGWTLLRRGVLDTTLCYKVCQLLAADRCYISWYSSLLHQYITEVLLKVALSTINQPTKHKVRIYKKKYWNVIYQPRVI